MGAHLKSAVLKQIFRFIQRRSGTTFGFKVQSAAEFFRRASHNASYDFATNGEMRALAVAVAGIADPVIFDVGAHNGGWSLSVLDIVPNATLFAFEPAAETFSRLQRAASPFRQIRPFPIGLSDSTGARELLFSRERGQKSSTELHGAAALNRQVVDYARETADFMSGDEFCSSHEIQHIDFLKVDTEGHDIKVLRGFERHLAEQRITAIQFEYNRLNIFARALLLDFYELLGKAYEIGRIYPQGVCFKAYDVKDETFIDGNFLAVRKDVPDLLRRLAGGV